jgi:hypothetical protein
VTINLEAGCFFQRHCRGLMGSLLEHGREPEKFPVAGFVNDDLLLVLVYRSHAHAAGNHDVSLVAGIVHFVNSLARGKRFQLHLTGKDSGFFFIEQRKKRNLFQRFRSA